MNTQTAIQHLTSATFVVPTMPFLVIRNFMPHDLVFTHGLSGPARLTNNINGLAEDVDGVSKI
jgi:hypothetical protein